MDELDQLQSAAKNWRLASLLALIAALGTIGAAGANGYLGYQSEIVRQSTELTIEREKVASQERAATCEEVFDFLKDDTPSPVLTGNLGETLKDEIEDAARSCIRDRVILAPPEKSP